MQWLRQLFSRARGADPRRFDLVLAGVLLATALVEVLLLGFSDASWWVGIPVAVAATAPLLLRRSHTVEACALFGAVLLLESQLGALERATAPFLVIFILFYSLGRYTRGWSTLVGAAIVYASVTSWTFLAEIENESPLLFTLAWSIALLAPPVALGRITRGRLEMQAELRDLTARLESDRGRREQRAIDVERGRIAEELQTLVANNVSAMVVQAGVVRPALAIPAPTTADTALATIEESGRDALVEMRRLLGVLRRDDAQPELAPQPSLERAEALVEHARSEGAAVHLYVDGTPEPLPRGVDLAGYRLLQELLDTAARTEHVDRTQVVLGYGEGEVTVAVAMATRRHAENGPLVSETTLSTLRERVGLYGGTLRAGRLSEGEGFRVTAKMPVEGAA
ncbi:MAG TPA: histidine kinase [Thermoleophilaceae bacterium]|nr:histidine kinase [Thermoleophilaceae bacterium]